MRPSRRDPGVAEFILSEVGTLPSRIAKEGFSGRYPFFHEMEDGVSPLLGGGASLESVGLQLPLMRRHLVVLFAVLLLLGTPASALWVGRPPLQTAEVRRRTARYYRVACRVLSPDPYAFPARLPFPAGRFCPWALSVLPTWRYPRSTSGTRSLSSIDSPARWLFVAMWKIRNCSGMGPFHLYTVSKEIIITCTSHPWLI